MEVMEPERVRGRGRLGGKGRVVIPASVREAAGMKEGASLDFEVVDGVVQVSTWESRLRRVQERASRIIPAGVSLADELSAERREAAKHE